MAPSHTILNAFGCLNRTNMDEIPTGRIQELVLQKERGAGFVAVDLNANQVQTECVVFVDSVGLRD